MNVGEPLFNYSKWKLTTLWVVNFSWDVEKSKNRTQYWNVSDVSDLEVAKLIWNPR